MAISIADPITQAIARAKLITFQPFNLGKWFTLGFVAWLASLGEGGGGNFNTQGWGGGGGRGPAPAPLPTPRPGPFPGPGPMPRRGPTGSTSTGTFDDIVQWISSHMAGAVLIALLIVLAIVAISLIVVWINSRAKFMFIEAVARDTCEVVAPWKRYRALGNSLFGFKAILTCAGLVGMILIVGVALALAWPDIRAERFGSGATGAILVGVLGLLPLILVLAIIGWCTDTFVAPIMYARGIPVMPAWTEFRQNVVSGHVGHLVLFGLMQIVLGIGIGVASMIIGCATCCIGLLPYLNTVVTLPLQVFWRAYSIYFLQQFNPAYAIIVESAPPPTGGFPVMPMPPGYAPQYPYPQGYSPPPPPPPPPAQYP
jgi:hypothetical protein